MISPPTLPPWLFGKGAAIPGPVPAPGRVTAPVPGRVTAAVPGRVTAAVPGRVTAAVPGRVTAAVPGRVTAAVPGRVTAARGEIFAVAAAVDVRFFADRAESHFPLSRKAVCLWWAYRTLNL